MSFPRQFSKILRPLASKCRLDPLCVLCALRGKKNPLAPNQVVACAGEGFDAYAAPVESIPIPASRARTIASAREVAPIFQKMFVT